MRKRHVLPLLATRLVNSTRFKMHEQALLNVVKHASKIDDAQLNFPTEALQMMLKARHFYKEDYNEDTIQTM